MSEPIAQLKGALAAEEKKLLACVHCGLCLEACPTYVQTGDENDSPRGRIYLMRAVEEQRLAQTSLAFTRHIDRCLGCRACESACPAGVEYGQLLEAARFDIATKGSRPGWTARALHLVLHQVWLHPQRLRAAFALARTVRASKLPRLLVRWKGSWRIPLRMKLALALLDASAQRPFKRPLSQSKAKRPHAPEREQLSVKERGVLLFLGCVMEGLFARVNRATERVLGVNQYRWRAPRGQVCCGALHAHAGDLEGARRLARQNIEAFSDGDDAPIITNAGGCGAMLAGYGHLLAGDESYRAKAEAFSRRVRDISQQLATGDILRGEPLDERRTTYDASCHLLHGQRANLEPLRILEAIPGLSFTPLTDADVCCGGAGVYNLLETELSAQVLAEKLEHIRASGAQRLATGNPGCHMQICAGAQLEGLSLEVCHPVELLDESYRRAGFYEESGQQKLES